MKKRILFFLGMAAVTAGCGSQGVRGGQTAVAVETEAQAADQTAQQRAAAAADCPGADGMIWEYTMSGEEFDTGAEYFFKKIADDGYSMKVEHTYTSHYDSQSGTKLSYRDNEPITWEKYQKVINHATNSDSFVKDLEWNDLVAIESGIDRFLGTYTKNYGSYSYALILSVEEGALRYEVGNSYHGGWMASQYAEYSINGNELKATKEDGVHIFILNEDGSITATFSDMDFNNGIYERNDEYDETEEYPEGYPPII